MTTILTIEKLKEIAPITSALGNQVDLLIPFIDFAETAHIKEDLLGEALYSQLISNIEAGVWSGSNQTLCETYLYNLSAWYSFYEASPFIAYRAEAKGLTKKFSDNSQPLDRDEIKDFKQSIYDKALFWRNATIKYLTNNKTLYPLWRMQYYGKATGTNLDDCGDVTGYGGTDYSGGIFV